MESRTVSHGKTRLERFTDVALAAILVLGALNARSLFEFNGLITPGDLGVVAARLLVYFAGVLTIGVVWLNHAMLLAPAEAASKPLFWLNLHLLLWAALLPPAAAGLTSADMTPVETMAYGVVLTGVLASEILLRLSAWSPERADRVPAKARESATWRSLAALLISGGSIPLASLSIPAALVCFILAPLMFAFPDVKTQPAAG